MSEKSSGKVCRLFDLNKMRAINMRFKNERDKGNSLLYDDQNGGEDGVTPRDERVLEAPEVRVRSEELHAQKEPPDEQVVDGEANNCDRRVEERIAQLELNTQFLARHNIYAFADTKLLI